MHTKATRDTVFAAADELTASSRPVSIDAIIEMVGGSKTTVSPLLTEWRAEEERRRGVVDAGEPPERVETLLVAAARQAWTAAVEEAHKRFARERAAHTAAVETLQGEIERHRSRITELEAEVGDLAGQLGSAEAEARRARGLDRMMERMKLELERANAALDETVAEERRQRERAAVAEARAANHQAAPKPRDKSTVAKPKPTKVEAEAADVGLPFDARDTDTVEVVGDDPPAA